MFRSFLSPFLGLMMVVVACTDDVTDPQESDVNCSTPATVRDLTGLDGCGFVFELEDGTHLIPIIAIPCFTPPAPKDTPPNPIIGYQFVDGKKVLINYNLNLDYYSVCMAGEYASITCIKDAPQTQTDL